MAAEGFHVHAEESIFEGHMITLVTATVEVPDGTRVEREIVRHPGAVAIVALNDDGEVLLERQYRAALDMNVYEIPAGKRDVADEPPEVAARRELLEETGFEAEHWTVLATFLNSPGFTDERSIVFLAEGLRHVGHDLQGPEEEAMEVEWLPLSKVWGQIAAGELQDGKSIIGLTLAMHHLELRV